MIKKYWKWFAVTVLGIGIAYAGAPAKDITQTLDGRLITFAYTENKNDSLAIYTEQKDFTIPVSSPLTKNGETIAGHGLSTIYFAVKNNSGADQTVIIASTANNIELTNIKIWGTVTAGTSSDKWIEGGQVTGLKTFISERPVTGDKISTVSGFFIPTGQTKFFKAIMKYSLLPGQTDEFFLEAKGQNAYGHSQ